MGTNSQNPPKGYHVNLENMDVESSSIEEIEDNGKEMETIDTDNIDWAAIHASHMALIKAVDDDDEEEDDYDDEDFENDEEDDDEDEDDYENDNYYRGTQEKDRNLELWEEILNCENDPDFFLKICEFRQNHYGDTQLGRECYNKLKCYRINTSEAEHFQATVRTLIENYLMFGFSCQSNKPYSQPSTHDNFWRLLKDAREILKIKPSLLDSETKQMLDNLLEEKEKSSLWYKIKKLFNLV